MASGGFSFGFDGDDIEVDDTEIPRNPHADSSSGADVSDGSNAVPPQAHKLEDLISSLPDQLGYTTTTITSPNGKSICLPRRELWDIRMQLMAEDDGSKPDLLAGLEESDVRTNVYEGGFKTWECSIDLVKFLLDRGPRKDIDDLHRVDHVIELGAGTALPTLTLFHYALTHSLPLTLTIADYNPTVLTHSTLPNLLLTYISTLPATSAPFSPSTPNPLAPGPTFQPTSSIALTPSLLSSFTSTLSRVPITLTLLSGSWTPVPRYTSLIPSTPSLRTLILASETIYSPAALTAFTSVLAALLERVRAGKALVAAKKVYFGVGGGVDVFKEGCAERGMIGAEVEFGGLGEGGVRRCIVEVQRVGGGEVE